MARVVLSQPVAKHPYCPCMLKDFACVYMRTAFLSFYIRVGFALSVLISRQCESLYLQNGQWRFHTFIFCEKHVLLTKALNENSKNN